MKDFDWSRIGFWFPEFDKDGAFIPEPNPRYNNGVINFSMENGYGGQIFLNQEIPKWIEDNKGLINKDKLNKYFENNSKKIYHRVLNELTEALPIFEKWRKFISKHNGREWVGNLQNNLGFENTHGGVNMGDYYTFYINSQNPEHPTGRLFLIGKTPSELLNKEALEYHRMSKNVTKGGKMMSNLISGKSLIDCIRNADEIYEVADELRDIEF